MKYLITFLLIFLSLTTGWVAHTLYNRPSNEPNPVNQVKPRPLDKYTIENLSKANIEKSQIIVGDILDEKEEFTTYLFSINLDPTLSGGEKKKVTGTLNIPKGEGPFPLILMFRGYVDQKLYKSGDGTRRAGEAFANGGFITIAPDFLGYGESDKESSNIFESRFQTYTTALVLLKSISTIQPFDHKNVFLWGHSNGGQVALTLLEITGKEIPTVLWAPVSKPFPYSVLYYTDESDDRGKLIRRELASFEDLYDTDLYSIHKYYDRIEAPIELHQGSYDDAVPVDWSDTLNKTLEKLDVDIKYFKYPGADHNLNPSWNSVISRNIDFFNGYLTNSL